MTQSLRYWLDALLRTHLSKKPAPLAVGGPCLVLGSAPEPSLPCGFDSRWAVVTVNAAQASLDRLGWERAPDVTIISAQMFGPRPQNVAGQAAIRGRRTGHLLLIDRPPGLSAAAEALERLDYKFTQLSSIDRWQRSKVSFTVLRRHVALATGGRKISTGIFAALLALYSRAKPVVLSGFSLSKAGHAYNDFGHRRSHIDMDAVALAIAVRRGLPLFAAERDFSLETGLKFWSPQK